MTNLRLLSMLVLLFLAACQLLPKQEDSVPSIADTMANTSIRKERSTELQTITVATEESTGPTQEAALSIQEIENNELAVSAEPQSLDSGNDASSIIELSSANDPASSPQPQVAHEQQMVIAADDNASSPSVQTHTLHDEKIESLCTEIGEKLGSVSVTECRNTELKFTGSFSVNQRPLTMKEFLPEDGNNPVSRILILGGIHGDEYSSISIMFKWMGILAAQPDSYFHWRFLPLANPDGLLDRRAIRMNANGVDLNRNFPSKDWNDLALKEWARTTSKNPRRYPGEAAASEPEVQWLVNQIADFKPDAIVSVHAPYDLLDFDGPAEAPQKIGQLYLHQLGVYPGSLGNYGGLDLGIPVVTLELPSAGIMPSNTNIQNMWDDLHSWLSMHSTSLTAADFKRENLAGE